MWVSNEAPYSINNNNNNNFNSNNINNDNNNINIFISNESNENWHNNIKTDNTTIINTDLEKSMMLPVIMLTTVVVIWVLTFIVSMISLIVHKLQTHE